MSVKTIGNLPIMYIGDVEKATSKPRPTIYRESREGTGVCRKRHSSAFEWEIGHD